jgi:hypothetical protein
MMDSNSEHRNADRSRAVLLRDAALARVRLTRRWVIAGAAALTAGFAALVSAVAPGRSLSSSSSKSPSARADLATRGAGSALPSMPAPASAGDLGLRSPGQGPTPDQSQPSRPQSVPPQPQPQSLPPAPPSGGVVSGGS